MKARSISPDQSRQLPDAEVVQRVLAGEKELYEILLRRYNQHLYRAVRACLGRESEVEDIMQDTYLKAYEKLHQFRGDAAFPTWLLRIGINEALARIRTTARHRRLYPLGPAAEEKLFRLPETRQMNPENKAIQAEMRRLLETAIDELPEKYRLVYVLREVDDMPYPDIMACLNLTESNVKVRLHRAKHLLKEKLFQLSAGQDIFEFGNSRCDSVVAGVMRRLG